MTFRMKQGLLTLVAGSAMAVAPMAFATVVVPATSAADEGAQGSVSCPDGTIVDAKNNKCVSLKDGLAKQLKALPPPPGLEGFGGGGGGGGGIGGVSGLGRIPSLGTVNLPDIVLPSLGLGLVPDFNLNVQPRFPGF